MLLLIGLVDDQIRLLTFLKISDERRNAWAALFGRTDHRRVPSATRCASDVVGSLCILCVQPPPKRKDEAEEEIEEMATRLLTETMGPQKRLPRRPRRWSINGNKHKQRAVIVQHFSLSFFDEKCDVHQFESDVKAFKVDGYRIQIKCSRCWCPGQISGLQR